MKVNEPIWCKEINSSVGDIFACISISVLMQSKKSPVWASTITSGGLSPKDCRQVLKCLQPPKIMEEAGRM